MRIYEFALVLVAGAGKGEAEVIKLTAEIVSKVKGKITKTDCLGLRPLAYPVKKATQGWVLFMEIELLESEVKSFDRHLKIDEKVLRHLIIKKE
ncbi:MAG: 30S ribosomal protein S6 [Candidatus Beckwithbacteria bacterium]